MTHTVKGLFRLSVAAVVGGMALFWSGDITLSPQGSLVSSAHAIIGRPLTPMSYAGVARRTTRRAYAYGGAVYAAPMVVAPGPVVVAPRCVQAVDAYGRLYTRCY